MLGLCTQCGGPRDSYLLRCYSCREKFRAYAKKHRKLHPDRCREAHIKYIKSNRHKGLCSTCGKAIDNPVFKRCSHCREGTRRWYNKDPFKVKLRRIELRALDKEKDIDDNSKDN